LLALLLWLSVAYAVHVIRVFGGATIDDAAITYAYADNLAHGRGLRLTPGEAPTEGFSNFLEVLLLAPVARFTDLDFPAKLLNVGALTALLFLLVRFVAARLQGLLCLVAVVPLLIVFTWPGFSYWTASGLEGGLLAALQIASLLLLASSITSSTTTRLTDLALGVCAGLLAFCRPEGAFYGAIVIGARLLSGPGWRRPAAAFAGMIALLITARYALFRDFVPNTYWSKINDEVSSDSGLLYINNFLEQRPWYFACALPLLAPWAPRLGLVALAAFAQLLFAFFFAFHAGGDWMKEFRFLQPAMGPLITLHALGILAVCQRDPAPNTSASTTATTGSSAVRRAATVFAFLAPLLLWAITAPGWAETARKVSGQRDVDMRKLAFVAGRYRDLAARLHLPRPLVLADVDAGGTSYRSGLDVIDLGGLGDRVLGRAFTRETGRVVDYLFGERRPDVIHVHGPWHTLIPIDSLTAFHRLYRPLDTSSLTLLNVGPLTAIRAALIDPPARPAVNRFAQLHGARLLGLSAVAVEHQQVLFVHARSEGALPTLFWKGKDGVRHPVAFHAGLGLNSWPAGTALVGSVRLPATDLPQVLEGVQDAPGTPPTQIVVDTWPAFIPEAPTPATAEGLARLPLARLAGAPLAPCDPTSLLDPAAPAVNRARGAAFVAQLCGAPPPELGARLAADARRAAADARDADDRYEAAVAVLALAPPGSIGDRVAIEKARAAHHAHDDVLRTFAERDLQGKAPTPIEIERGLATLYAARAFDEILLRALAFGFVDEPRARPVLCATAATLGLRAVTPALTCTGAPPPKLPQVLRQGFEDAGDRTVAYLGPATRWRAQAARPGQRRVLGNEGGWFLNSFLGPESAPPPAATPPAAPPPAAGEVVWGPFPAPGRRFGVLLAGGGKAQSTVRVEEQRDGKWVELWRTTEPPSPTVLAPQLTELPTTPGKIVRVRVIEDRAAQSPFLVDAPTFVEGP
jgi:hypothetical protein